MYIFSTVSWGNIVRCTELYFRVCTICSDGSLYGYEYLRSSLVAHIFVDVC